MRTFLIAGNWKMNGKPSEAAELAKAMVSKWEGKTLKSEPLICPPFISVPAVAEAFKGSSFKTGAQNVHTEESGAFTGETSAAMLKEDRKSTRLNSSHVAISYAVFCLKKKRES